MWLIGETVLTSCGFKSPVKKKLMWRLHFNGSESISSGLQICVSRGNSRIRLFALRSSGGKRVTHHIEPLLSASWCCVQNAECSQVGDMNGSVMALSC